MHADITIVGGGPSGLSLAALLGTRGFSVAVVERHKRVRPVFDGRTLALSYRSMELLRRAKVAPLILGQASPILSIRVADQGSHARLDFDSRSVGSHPFGWIVEHHLFRQALEKRLRGLRNVRIFHGRSVEASSFTDSLFEAQLSGGTTLTSPLCVAADGRLSPLRSQAGIEVYGWDYHQSAIACVIRHREPHHQIAVEDFGKGGPFAVLPMTKNRSSIIWSETRAVAAALMRLKDDDFRQRLEAKVGPWLGTIELLGPRFAYPLALSHAKTYRAQRLALIGDAAHSLHPIAGQGFNLGMGDIEALDQVLVAGSRAGCDLGADTLLKRYERLRLFANGNMVLATDGLVRLFSNDLPGLTSARRLGLQLVEKAPPLKRFFMRTAMGLKATG